MVMISGTKLGNLKGRGGSPKVKGKFSKLEVFLELRANAENVTEILFLVREGLFLFPCAPGITSNI